METRTLFSTTITRTTTCCPSASMTDPSSVNSIPDPSSVTVAAVTVTVCAVLSPSPTYTVASSPTTPERSNPAS